MMYDSSLAVNDGLLYRYKISDVSKTVSLDITLYNDSMGIEQPFTTVWSEDKGELIFSLYSGGVLIASQLNSVYLLSALDNACGRIVRNTMGLSYNGIYSNAAVFTETCVPSRMTIDLYSMDTILGFVRSLLSHTAQTPIVKIIINTQSLPYSVQYIDVLGHDVLTSDDRVLGFNTVFLSMHQWVDSRGYLIQQFKDMGYTCVKGFLRE